MKRLKKIALPLVLVAASCNAGQGVIPAVTKAKIWCNENKKTACLGSALVGALIGAGATYYFFKKDDQGFVDFINENSWLFATGIIIGGTTGGGLMYLAVKDAPKAEAQPISLPSVSPEPSQQAGKAQEPPLGRSPSVSPEPSQQAGKAQEPPLGRSPSVSPELSQQPGEAQGSQRVDDYNTQFLTLFGGKPEEKEEKEAPHVADHANNNSTAPAVPLSNLRDLIAILGRCNRRAHTRPASVPIMLDYEIKNLKEESARFIKNAPENADAQSINTIIQKAEPYHSISPIITALKEIPLARDIIAKNQDLNDL